MIAVLPEQRLAHAVLASIVGVAIAWTIESPLGLLAPAAALFLYARGCAIFILNAALVLMAAGLSLLAMRLQSADVQALAMTWVAFCVLALCIGAIVTRAAAQNDVGLINLRRHYPGEARNDVLGGAAADKPSALNLVHPDERASTAHAAARAFWTGVPQITRHRQLQADGTYRWTETRSEPGYSVSIDIDDLVTDKDPQTGTAPDRPSDNDAEAIRSAKIVETIFGNGWAFDASGRWIYLHPFAQNSLGVTLQDLNAPLDDGHTGWKRVLHPDDYERIAAEWRHCLRTGDYFNVEFRFRRANSAYVWARTAARPVRDGDDRITGWFGIALDIDVYKRTVEALRARERELSQLIDVVPSHLWRLTPEGEPTFFNKRMVDFLGMDVVDTERPGMTRLSAMVETVHPDDAAQFAETLDRSLRTGEPFAMRYRLRRVDGVYRWMSSRAEALRDSAGCIVHWYGLCHDIDDQLLAEEALRASKRQLEQMLDAVPVNILSFDPSGTMTYASKRYLEQVGAPLGHIRDFDALARDVIHPEDFPAMFARASNGFATGQPFVNRMRRRDSQGVYRWIEARAQPLRDADGTVLQWYIASIDLEDEIRAQEALRESERMFRQLVETLPAMIDCANPDGEPIYRSRQLREFLGIDLQALDDSGKPRLAGTLDASVHPDELTAVKEHYSHCLRTGEPYIRKHRLRRQSDGEYRWVETRAAAMRGADGAIVQWSVICLDIDSEVRAQEQLRVAQETLARASQAASLAELSASIAHEVNQPLAAIVANSHACQRWLESDPPNLERAGITAERIIRDANAAADVVSRIRALFRQTLQARTCSTLEPIVAEVTRWVEDLARKNGVIIAIDIDAELPQICIDKVQIQQVLINLLRNAVEAMHAIGGARRIDLRARRDGESVLVEVRDRGCGIENPEKIFNAFFTTKDTGMGMGLPICRSIVESHGGRLWAESNDEGGSTFSFTLPLDRPDAA